MHASDNATAHNKIKTTSRNRAIMFTPVTGDIELDHLLGCIRAVDWSSTPLGSLESWPADLLQLCHVVLLDPQPRALLLGPDLRMFYNKAYSETCGDKHPHALGQTVDEAWKESTEAWKPGLDQVALTGRELLVSGSSMIYERNGFLEEVFLTWAIIPLIGQTEGFCVALTDVTEAKLAEKRRAALRALDTAWSTFKDPHEFWQGIPQSLSMDPFLFPFAALYAAVPDPNSGLPIDVAPETVDDMHFRLEGVMGDLKGLSMLPQTLTTEDFRNVPYLLRTMTLKEPVLVKSNGESAGKEWPLAPIVICPVRSNRSSKVIALLYLGIDPKRPYNEAHQEWIGELVRYLGNAATSTIIADEGKRKQHTTARQAAKEQHLLATALATRDKEAIALSNQFQRTLKVVDMAGVGIFEFDLDGRLIYANDAYCAMSGYSREIPSRNKLAFLDVCFPEDTDYVLSKWNRIRKGFPITFEMRHLPSTANGEAIWIVAACVPVLQNGIVTSISGCTTNITSQKHAETASQHRVDALERAKASEQRFVKFAESSPVSIFFGDAATGCLTYCNPAWFAMTGHPQAPFDEISWESTVYEEDFQSVKRVWNEIVVNQASMSFQFRLKRRWVDKNGVAMGPLYVAASALPEFNDDGQTKGVIVTMQDISALKFAETLQKTRLEEAIEAKRQQENFIDMTSHEIRNPLGAVSICSDAVLETLSEMDALAKRLLITSASASEAGKQLQELVNNAVDSISTVISCSAHQRRIVDDILVLSKLDSNLLQIAPSAVQVESLLHDAEKMFGAEAERNHIKLSVEAHPSIKELSVDWALIDPGRVQQVLINLVTNAIKFTKKRPQRKVIIRMGASKARPSESLLPVEFTVARSLHESIYDEPGSEVDNFYLWFVVQDTGRGMTAEEKGKIFARFTQGSPKTYNEYGGSGLGLFISRELSELQGGEIGVASEIDVGSTFAFFVKARHTKVPETLRLDMQSLKLDPNTSPADIPNTKTSILVVEDNRINQIVLQKNLVKQGYDVSVADNGQDAIDFIKMTRHWKGQAPDAKNISVILMDVNMPVLDGLSATRKIREFEMEGEISAHIPIIAVSANARPEQTKQAIEAGMDDSIAKPFRIADLVPKIDRLASWARVLGP